MSHLLNIGETLQAFFEMGGDVLFAIFLVTMLMWVLILERYIFYRWYYPQHAQEATDKWITRTDKTSWKALQIKRLYIAQISQELKHSLPMIKTLVALCPLMGLLGTVTGMIEVFDIMALVGSGNARAMAAGVSKATIPTMAGMVAALSGLYLSVRLARKADEMATTFEDGLIGQ